jgi:hypothetical protein
VHRLLAGQLGGELLPHRPLPLGEGEREGGVDRVEQPAVPARAGDAGFERRGPATGGGPAARGGPATGGGATAAPDARPLVAVGSFTDNRGQEPTYLGTIRGGYGNPLKRLHTGEPITETVRKAFAGGLKARGLLASGGGGGAAPYTLAGAIHKFDCNQFVRREADADITLTLTETATGKTVATLPMKRQDVSGSLVTVNAGVFGSVDDLRDVAAETLRRVVDETLDSPSFKQAVR